MFMMPTCACLHCQQRIIHAGFGNVGLFFFCLSTLCFFLTPIDGRLGESRAYMYSRDNDQYLVFEPSPIQSCAVLLW